MAAGGGGGLVSPRDFVNLRHYGMRGASMVCAGQSVEHPLGPETSKYIRYRIRNTMILSRMKKNYQLLILTFRL